jgi:hypothetical protein
MLERGAVVLEPKNALKLAALDAGEAPPMEGLSGKRAMARDGPSILNCANLGPISILRSASR